MESIDRQELATLHGQLLPRVVPAGIGASLDLVPGQLGVGFFLETPEGTRTVEERDMSLWRAPQDLLTSIAIDNLRLRSSTDSWYSLRAVPGMLVYLAGDGNAAARMLILRELIDPWPLGGVLVSVPTPDQLLVVPLDSLDNLSVVQVLVQSGHLAHSLGKDAVTDQVFWYDGHEWAHMVVQHNEDTVEVLPPPGFLRTVEKLAALGMTNFAGEA